MSSNREWYERQAAVMPWQSSTCTKKAQLVPDEPSVIVRGKGCRVWDADGREFIDFRNSLGPITLGYGFPAVDEAIQRQLADGIIFGHPHPLECEVAELLCEHLPGIEKARFLKTGGEALAACIRISRSFTKRDAIIQIGYNGWLNSLAGGGQVLPGRESSGPPPGIPLALSELHHAFAWNDQERLSDFMAKQGGEVAAIVVAASYPQMAQGESFYPFLRELADRHGALLVYDEIVTGFRIRLGGVNEYFGVRPDLAVFAKGMANGMPLSCYCGQAEVMDELERCTISSTYGGEALSLAAARATLETYLAEPVIEHLWTQGKRMWDGLEALFAEHGLPVTLPGLDPVRFLSWGTEVPVELPERFLRAAYRHGVSLYNGGYVSYSHGAEDIDEALERLAAALSEIA